MKSADFYMRVVVIIMVCVCSPVVLAQTDCVAAAKEIQPQLSAETQREFEAKLNEARERFEKDSRSADNIIWLGRRTAYLGRYKDAIRIFTQGVEQFPPDARLYRHRGHRYITLRCFDAAIADFEKASQLVRGKPDEIEPDGLPNARNIPTSTLQSNIWYHLGLAYYLKGDFQRALSAYREAEKVSKNADMLVATTHWLYMTLRRLGREKEAGRTLLPIKDNLDLIENADYYKMIRVYKGQLDPANVWAEISQRSDNLSNATIGYGLGNWFLYNGRRAEAEKIFRQVTAGNQWSSFGYIAAEVELKQPQKAQNAHKMSYAAQTDPDEGGFVVAAFLGGARTASSDLEISQPALGNNLNFERVRFNSRSFDPPLYYGFRGGYFFNRMPSLGVEAEFIHLKVFSDPQQQVRVTGERHNVPINRELALGEIVQQYSISHGVNLLLFNVAARRRVDRLILTARAGLGPTLPHTESRIEEQPQEQYEFGSLGWQAAGGAEVQLWRKLYLLGEYKFTRTRQRGKVFSGTAESLLQTYHGVFGLSYHF